jgi:1,4-alpha-glucan branching enzyme
MHHPQPRGYCKKYQLCQRLCDVVVQAKGGEFGAGCGEFHVGTREAYRIGVPFAGQWNEVLNSDSSIYAGSNYGNSGGVAAEETSNHAQVLSLVLKVLNLPPLAVFMLRPEG